MMFSDIVRWSPNDWSAFLRPISSVAAAAALVAANNNHDVTLFVFGIATCVRRFRDWATLNAVKPGPAFPLQTLEYRVRYGSAHAWNIFQLATTFAAVAAAISQRRRVTYIIIIHVWHVRKLNVLFGHSMIFMPILHVLFGRAHQNFTSSSTDVVSYNCLSVCQIEISWVVYCNVTKLKKWATSYRACAQVCFKCLWISSLWIRICSTFRHYK